MRWFRTKRLFTTLLTTALALGLVACDDDDGGSGDPGAGGEPGAGGSPGMGGEPGMGGAPGEFVGSEKARVLDPQVPDADLAALVEGQRDFTASLHQVLAADADGNLFYSPFSIHQALAMTWAGARGDTEAQMANALHFDLDQAALHPAQNRLDLALESRADTPTESGEPLQLSIANQVWGRTGYQWLPAFLDVLAEQYGAGLREWDFVADPEGGRQRINQWVEDQTNERIKDLIPEGAINASTVMVLVNAIFFKASWATPFEPEQTADADFNLADGSTVQVPTMYAGAARARYGAGPGWEAIALPYAGNETSMLVVVPDDLGAFEAAFEGQTLRAIDDPLAGVEAEVYLPKFSFESGFQLNDAMMALGMEDAFGGAADFSGMNGTGGLFIQAIFHKAFVAVDEEGTEAAAATAVLVGETSVPMQVEVRIDRPFLFFIRDDVTGAVLFAGRVMDPR